MMTIAVARVVNTESPLMTPLDISAIFPTAKLETNQFKRWQPPGDPRMICSFFHTCAVLRYLWGCCNRFFFVGFFRNASSCSLAADPFEKGLFYTTDLQMLPAAGAFYPCCAIYPRRPFVRGRIGTKDQTRCLCQGEP